MAGRRIDHVVDDFESAGLRLPNLYSRLLVPCAGFDLPGFTSRWADALGAAFRAYGRQVGQAEVQSFCLRMTVCSTIDFGSLDETAQRECTPGFPATGASPRASRKPTRG